MLQNKSASCGSGTQGLRGMAKKSDDQYSKKEAAQRFEAALKGARSVAKNSEMAEPKAKPRQAKQAGRKSR
jgi:hypothetical protein